MRGCSGERAPFCPPLLRVPESQGCRYSAAKGRKALYMWGGVLLATYPIDVALIGLGGYGGTHRRSLAALQKAGLARLAAVAEINQKRYAEVVGALKESGVTVYANWEEMLDSGRFDIVAIAAPLHLHCRMVVAALKRGYPVFCEKSAAVTAQDIITMQTAAEQADLPCGIDFQWLSSASISKLKQLVVEGSLGQVRRVIGAGLWKRPDAYYERTFWAGKFRIGNEYVFDGPMYNALAHMLNNCLYLASSKPGHLLAPQRVRGEMYRAIPLPEMEDTATLHLVGEEGVEVLYFATYCSPKQYPHYYRVEGTRGTAILEEGNLHLLREGSSTLVLQSPDQGSTELMYRNFFAALDGKEKLLSPIEASLSLVRAQNGAYISSGRVHPVVEPNVRRYAEKDTTATEILGIESLCQGCATEGQLFSDAGAPWAQVTPWVDVTELKEYMPRSPEDLR